MVINREYKSWGLYEPRFFILGMDNDLYIKEMYELLVRWGFGRMKSKLRSRIIPKLLITYFAILLYTLSSVDVSNHKMVFSTFISWTVMFCVVYLILEFDIVGRVSDFQTQLEKYKKGEQNSLFDMVSDEFGDIVRETNRIIREGLDKNEEIKKQVDLYQSLVHDVPILVVRYLPSGEIVFKNNTYKEYFEDSVFFDLSRMSSREDHVLGLSQVNPSNSFVEVDSGGRNILWINRAIFDKYKRVQEYQSVGMDITEHKKFTGIYQKITDNQTDILLEFDLEGKCMFVTPSFSKRLGFNEDLILKGNVLDLVHESDRDLVTETFHKCIEEETGQVVEFRILDYRGRSRWFEAQINSYVSEETKSLIVSCREVTENVKNRSLLEVFFNQSVCGAYIAEHDPVVWNKNTDKERDVERVTDTSVIVKANKALADLYGIELEELVNMKVKDLYGLCYSQIDLDNKDVHQMFDTGNVHKLIRAKKHSGEDVILDGSMSSIFDDLGRVIGSISLQKDVTESYLSQEDMEKSRKILDFILRSTSDLLVRIDKDGNCLDIWSCDDSVISLDDGKKPKSVFSVLDKSDADRLMKSIETCLETEKAQRVEYWLDVPRGRTLFEARISRISDTEVMAVVRDITKRDS